MLYEVITSIIKEFTVENHATIGVEDLNSGVYILELTEPDTGAMYTEKIVKQ